MALNEIVELSHLYGGNPDFVLAGGGNTSFKNADTLYVKPSGVALAVIAEDDFVRMDRAVIRSCFTLGDFADKDSREVAVKQLMLSAVRGGGRRPSVEAPLHEVLPFRYVVHTHPTLVNAMTCGKDGKKICAELFPKALWVNYCDPGFVLAKKVFDACQKYEAERGVAPSVIFLQNHGVFVGADEAEQIRALYQHIVEVLIEHCCKNGVALESQVEEKFDYESVKIVASKLRCDLSNTQKQATVVSSPFFSIPDGPLTPDHIVYAKSFGLTLDNLDNVTEKIAGFKTKRGYLPRMVSVADKAVFCAGKDKKAADTALALARNGSEIKRLAAAFGGVSYLTPEQRMFIENWEVESYRAKVAGGNALQLSGVVAVVAQDSPFEAILRENGALVFKSVGEKEVIRATGGVDLLVLGADATVAKNLLEDFRYSLIANPRAAVILTADCAAKNEVMDLCVSWGVKCLVLPTATAVGFADMIAKWLIS